ncbi:hypothetical protein KC19_9G043100 [Ceratodon purpureus]|uniref:Uncharacterized protein n=1 Tax=Ceratodon purpureus TaxID=3225 RepID=A0A8T0GU27_CERPU|nr:hypothetical protein KC19_9G043100 [Ceratodon purpureus]
METRSAGLGPMVLLITICEALAVWIDGERCTVAGPCGVDDQPCITSCRIAQSLSGTSTGATSVRR